VFRGDVAIADVLADDRSILALHQGVVVAVPRPGLGLRDQQFIEQFRHDVVDELTAVVGMKPQNAEGKLPEQGLQHGFQSRFANLRGGAHHLPLRHFIHRIDVIDPLHPSGDGNFWNVEHFTGQLSPVSDARYFVKVGEEFRHGLLAHLIFQNLKSIVWPVSTGGLRENGVGGYDWPLMLHASDEAHAQGALVTWAHWPYPSLEAPLDIALGRIDSIDLLTTGDPFAHHPILVDVYKMRGPKVYSLAPVDVYYHYLNCGFRVAMSSGSDKMALNPPLGSARTYVRTDAPLTYDSWIEGIRKGHTFATNYPLLEFSVNGVGPGRHGETHAWQCAPVGEGHGKVVRSVRPSGGHYAAVIDESIEVDRGGWIAARTHGPKMLPNGATWWQMPVFAHTSPVYLDMPGRPAPAAESARLFLDQLEYLERWVREGNFPTEDNRREALDLVRQARKIYQRLAREES